MAGKVKMNSGWAKEILMSDSVNRAVNAKAGQIASKARAIAGVDHSGDPIRIVARGGTRERTRARAFVTIDHPAAAAIEGKRSILGRSI